VEAVGNGKMQECRSADSNGKAGKGRERGVGRLDFRVF